jgi:hypothetical protein
MCKRRYSQTACSEARTGQGRESTAGSTPDASSASTGPACPSHADAIAADAAGEADDTRSRHGARRL